MHPGDLDRQLEQGGEGQRQRRHRDRVLPRRGDGGEHEQAEDQPAPPRLEPRVGEHADRVEHDHEQRQLEAHPEDDQQGDEEREVGVAGQAGDLHVRPDLQQERQALGDDEVGQHRARDEQHRGARRRT